MGKVRLGRKFIEAAKRMPALSHSREGEPFDIEQSEVAKWLCSQPGVMQYVFDKASNNGLIEYDRESGTWQGSDAELA